MRGEGEKEKEKEKGGRVEREVGPLSFVGRAFRAPYTQSHTPKHTHTTHHVILLISNRPCPCPLSFRRRIIPRSRTDLTDGPDVLGGVFPPVRAHEVRRPLVPGGQRGEPRFLRGDRGGDRRRRHQPALDREDQDADGGDSS